jgi:hypothetical protein
MRPARWLQLHVLRLRSCARHRDRCSSGRLLLQMVEELRLQLLLVHPKELL